MIYVTLLVNSLTRNLFPFGARLDFHHLFDYLIKWIVDAIWICLYLLLTFTTFDTSFGKVVDCGKRNWSMNFHIFGYLFKSFWNETIALYSLLCIIKWKTVLKRISRIYHQSNLETPDTQSNPLSVSLEILHCSSYCIIALYFLDQKERTIKFLVKAKIPYSRTNLL